MNQKSGTRVVVLSTILLAAIVGWSTYRLYKSTQAPDPVLASIQFVDKGGPVGEDDSGDVSCLDLLDSLSPKEAADCMQPTVRKVVVLVEDLPPIKSDGAFSPEEDGPIQLLIFIGKKGEIVTYNRQEYLASAALQILLKRLTKAHKIDKEWFIPTLPMDGLCT